MAMKLSNVWSSPPTPTIVSSTTLLTSGSSVSGPGFKSPADENRQMMRRCPWVEDSTMVSCMICGNDFTFFTRRYVVIITAIIIVIIMQQQQ